VNHWAAYLFRLVGGIILSVTCYTQGLYSVRHLSRAMLPYYFAQVAGWLLVMLGGPTP
jgi:hypothetical protein